MEVPFKTYRDRQTGPYKFGICIVNILLLSGFLSASFFSATAREILAQPDASNAEVQVQQVSFVTDDKVIIVGTLYYPVRIVAQNIGESNASSTLPAVILLHMLGQDRTSWKNFAQELQQEGFLVLAIDLRGNGQSVRAENSSKIISYQSFASDDFNKMVLDVKAAKQFLLQLSTNSSGNGSNSSSNIGIPLAAKVVVDAGKIALVGASIGANVALNYAATDHSISAVVLMSPGLDYRGVKTSDAAKQVTSPVYMLATSGDTTASESASQLCQELKAAKGKPCDEMLKLYQGSSSHGTDMLSNDLLEPPPSALITTWLKTQLIPEFSSMGLVLLILAGIFLLITVANRMDLDGKMFLRRGP